MLLKLFFDEIELSDAEYARLAERGYIYVLNENGNTKIIPQCVVLENSEIKSELLQVGSRVKEKHWNEFVNLKEKFVNAILSKTQPHLHKARLFNLQYTFFSDPWFVLYVLKHLLGNGKLKLPTEEQKKMLTTVIVCK